MPTKLLFFFAFICFCLSSCAQGIPNKEDQINGAVLAVPEENRAGATVLGFDAEGKLVTLREGTGNMICLADDPNKDGFNAACYHKDLDAFMARGRELKAEGKNGMEIFNIREEEAKSGKLKMPENPTTLHVLQGPGTYDSATGTVTNAFHRYVVYIPWATAETTGLPTKPLVPGGAWIMDPGTHRAHIMVTPPRE